MNKYFHMYGTFLLAKYNFVKFQEDSMIHNHTGFFLIE